MWFIDNINGINIKEIEEEKIDGIYSNTFPLFSQNDLVCRYGLFAQRGRTEETWRAARRPCPRNKRHAEDIADSWHSGQPRREATTA